ncbi:MAG: molybdopterin-guanine dinucleotide biosynthesis protein B [Nitrososphaerota archaeon]|nr:molybdopterin-guanine dinucleotide biosynthesis protein B [Nitrososphaerota archaeon]
MKIVLILGYSGAGKTSAISSIIRALTEQGRRVGTLKHIHEPSFTIDTKGKDTWKHAEAGASVVVALAPHELTIVRRGDTRRMTLDELLPIYRGAGVDYLLIEGLYMKLRKREGLVRILCADSGKDARDLLSVHPAPVCILAKTILTETGEFQGIPILSLPRDIKKVITMIG